MPWKECHVMDERVRFIARLLDGEKMAILCAEFGISRKTGYKIYDRYKDCGVQGLTDRSRRPLRQANRLPAPIEARMGIVFTEGVVKRRMSLQRFVEVTSSNAARLLGLYPRKGALAVGSDADIVLIDPAFRRTLAKSDFHVSDYSPWEGWAVQGWPVTTILRGKVMVDHGRLLGDTRDGRLVPRRISGDVLARPVC